MRLHYSQCGSTHKVTSAEKDVEVGGSGRSRTWVWRKVQEEARDDSFSAGLCVLCQQAAAGVPKCAICDRVSHDIIACTAATDDEKHAGAHDTGCHRQRGVGVRQDTRLS